MTNITSSIPTIEQRSRINILVDHRESHAPYLSYLARHPLALLTKTTLDAGDIQIGDLLIERKLWADLYLTTKEGRLFKQLKKLKNSSQRQLLILEGVRPVDYTQQIGYSGLHIRITAGWQIPIVYTRTAKETALVICKIASQMAYASAGPIKPRPRNSQYSEQTLAIHMLMQIPSVGFAKAKQLIEHFTTIAEVLNATEKELLRVPGIGPSRARMILSVDSRTLDL